MMFRLTPWLVPLSLLLACGRADDEAAALAQVSAALPELPAVPTKTVELMVEGTGCASCSVEIRRELRRLPGIVEVRQGESKRHLLVEFQDSRVQPLQILEAVQGAGYEAEMLVNG